MQVLLVCLLFLAPALLGAETAHRPNVLLILADDLGWGDVSCNYLESKITTPNIDRLAQQGLRLVSAYTPASVCSPTRYGLLTGRYPLRTWHKDGVLGTYDPSLIRPGRMTLGTLFQQLGYATVGVGKWHLGLDWPTLGNDPGDWNYGRQFRLSNKSATAERIDFDRPFLVGPNQVGFDEYFGTVQQGIAQLVFHNARVIPAFRTLPENHDDLFVDHAVRVVTQHRQRQPQRPFFLYVALGAPHHGRLAPERWRGKSGDGVRGDRILWADENVGRLMTLLDNLGVADETLVVFTSDNGPSWDQGIPGRNPAHRPMGPWRGYKGGAWDGGYRVPMIVRWPGKIRSGTTAGQLVCLTDLLATLADITAVRLPRWAGEDSFSMRPAWFGGTETVRDHVVLQSYPGVLSIRDGDWKLILATEGSGGRTGATEDWAPVLGGWDRLTSINVGQLYDLRSDPGETRNLFVQHSEVVARLRARLERIVLEDRSRPVD